MSRVSPQYSICSLYIWNAVCDREFIQYNNVIGKLHGQHIILCYVLKRENVIEKFSQRLSYMSPMSQPEFTIFVFYSVCSF